MGGQAGAPFNVSPPVEVLYRWAPLSSVQGAFTKRPRGVILHASRSTVDRSVEAEFKGTVDYAVGGADGKGWNATIGNDKYAVHIPATSWGWSAREPSSIWLAVEFSQARIGRPVDDAQLRAFAAWWHTEVLPIWPGLLPVLVHHATLDAAWQAPDGKTDVVPNSDPAGQQAFIDRCWRAIEDYAND